MLFLYTCIKMHKFFCQFEYGTLFYLMSHIPFQTISHDGRQQLLLIWLSLSHGACVLALSIAVNTLLIGFYSPYANKPQKLIIIQAYIWRRRRPNSSVSCSVTKNTLQTMNRIACSVRCYAVFAEEKCMFSCYEADVQRLIV